MNEQRSLLEKLVVEKKQRGRWYIDIYFLFVVTRFEVTDFNSVLGGKCVGWRSVRKYME